MWREDKWKWCPVVSVVSYSFPESNRIAIPLQLRIKVPVLGARFASFLVSQPYYSTNHLFQSFCPCHRTGHHTTIQQAGIEIQPAATKRHNTQYSVSTNRHTAQAAILSTSDTTTIVLRAHTDTLHKGRTKY